MIKKLSWTIVFITLAVFLTISSALAVPGLINYQGILTDNDDNPLNGPYIMNFCIYDAQSAGSCLWCEGEQYIQFTNGFFNVLLGTPTSVFDNDILFLQVEVEGEILTPRLQITSTAFAIKAGDATTAGDADTVDGQHASEFLGEDDDYGRSGVAEDLYEGTTTPMKLTDKYVEEGQPSSITTNMIQDGTIQKTDLNFTITGDGHSLDAADGDPADAVYVDNDGKVGINTPTPQYLLDLGRGGGRRLALYSYGDDFYGFGIGSSSLDFYSGMATGTEPPEVVIKSDGYVGIGTTNPSYKLDVTGIIRALNPGGTTGGVILGSPQGHPGVIMFSNAPENYRADMVRNTAGLGFGVHASESYPTSYRLFIANSGNVGIGTSSPLYKLHVESTGQAIYVNSTTATNDHAAIRARATTWANARTIGGKFESGSTYGIGVQGISFRSSGYGGHFSGATGIFADAWGDGKAAVFKGNVEIQDSAGTTVMELGEGLDVAEGFDVVDVKKDIKRGTVLIIDRDNPGKLNVSSEPYDSKVAGIVAGANGIGSGVRMGAGQFDHDVALAGRVYCNVDATEAGVLPGDLLTTSSLPGYAMKAADYERAKGAILGKAMQGLEQGKKGQILVLVTLQ
jgi:hypothetical protein